MQRIIKVGERELTLKYESADASYANCYIITPGKFDCLLEFGRQAADSTEVTMVGRIIIPFEVARALAAGIQKFDNEVAPATNVFGSN